jgi:hypothetical protein
VRVAGSRLVVIAAGLVAALASSCRGEKPAPPAGEGSSPSTSLRPLTADSALPPGHPPIDAAAPRSDAADTGSVAGSVAGTIAVAPSLKARVPSGVLFVIARSSADKRIVAVRREDVVTFPFRFKISGADAMIAGTPFAGPLDITARLSRSGDAVAAKGDVEGVARGIAVGSGEVRVTLDTVHE